MMQPCALALALLACAVVSWRDAAAQGADGTGAHRWTVTLGADQGWESNVRFVPSDAQSDFDVRVGAHVARTWELTRTRLTISGTGGVTRFRYLPDRNSSNYGAGIDVSRQWTPRLTGQLGYAYQSAFTSILTETLDRGLQLPVVLARTHAASGNVAYRASQRTTVAVDAQYTDVAFDSTILVGGRSLSSRLQTTHQLSRSSAVTLGYQLQWSESNDRDAAGHTVFGAWDLQLSRLLTARLSAGVTRTQSLLVGGSSAHVRAVGSAELGARRATTVFTARLERSVSQGFGLGRVLQTDQFTAQYGRALTRTLAVALRGEVAQSHDPADPTFSFRSGDGALDLRWEIMPDIVIGGGVFARGRDDLVRVTSTGVHFGLGYGGLLP